MMVDINHFEMRKPYLVCVDSDGCAMDTMDIKHYRCFGPAMIEEWNLEEWAELILVRWNEINLYTRTRGINRFKGLAIALREINEAYCRIEGVEELEHWVSESRELSNAALEKAIDINGSSVLKKVLSWSKRVNDKISTLTYDDKRPFEGSKEALQFAKEFADIAVVSSANLQAVEEEWAYYGMLDCVDVLLTQEAGSKAYCISEMLKKGYRKEHVLMVGDAPGDHDAASKNSVLYYPIIVGREKESWREFKDKAMKKFLSESYDGEYQQNKSHEFWKSLA